MSALLAGLTATAQPSLVFDARALSWEERCTAEALQGLANRDGARLYLDLGNGWDQKWLDIYAERNALQYERLAGLRRLLERFRDLPQGLVVYDPALDGSRYVALTLAGVEDLLPVTEDLLTGAAPSLRGDEDWAGMDFARAREADMAAWRLAAGPVLKLTPGRGLLMQEGNPEPGNDWSFMSYGPIAVDLARYPFLEVEVADVEGEGAGWAIKLTWDRNADGSIGGHDDDLVLPVQRAGGVQRWDIAELAGLIGRHVFSHIQLHVAGPGGKVLWRRVRFVSTEGQAPPVSPPKPLTDLGLPVRHDLRGRFKDSLAAYDWALREVMPRCNRRFAHAVNGLADGVRAGCGPFAGFDWPVTNGSFVFNLTCSAKEAESYGGSRVGGSPEQAETYRRILAQLEPPAQVTGYGEPEGDWCNLLSQHGHYSFHFGDNWSFHRHIPASHPPFRQKNAFTPGNVRVEPDKYYVCFMTSEGDTMKGPVPFFFGSWFEQERGSVPVNWGINPLMADQFPAMLEYFYDTATPNDYFFAGCSGAGYCYPDHMPNLDQFARHTGEACRKADTPCVDLWGAGRSDVVRRYAELARPLSLTINAAPARLNLLLGGTPVGYHELGYWQHAALGGQTDFPTAFADDATRAEAIRWLVGRIESIAARHYPPFVILVYADLHNYAHHCRLAGEVADALDSTRFKPARMDEAFAAIRAWSADRVLLGSPGINERLAWAALQGVPTRLPLQLTNCADGPRTASLGLHSEGCEPQRAEVRLGPGETRRADDLRLAFADLPAAPTARLYVRTGDERDRYDVKLTVVPWDRPAEDAEFAGLWSAAQLRHASGEALKEGGAVWGEVWASPAAGEKACHIVFGPYVDVPRGRYLVAFRIRLGPHAPDAEALPADTPVVSLDAFAGGYEGTAETCAQRDLRLGDFTGAGGYQWFTLELDWPGSPSLLETRVFWHGKVPVVADRVVAFRLP